MPRNPKNSRRLYLRSGRYYADLRPDGGRYFALVPPGQHKATADPVVAAALYDKHRAALLEQTRTEQVLGLNPKAELADFADEHLRAMESDGDYSSLWLDTTARHLDIAVAYFTEIQHDEHAGDRGWKRRRLTRGRRNLAQITAPDVTEFIRHLASRPGRGGRRWSPGTQRHCLNALSLLFRRAESLGYIPRESNPVRALLGKPVGGKSRTPLRDAWEMAVLLESARTAGPILRQQRSPAAGFIYELVATFALTGAREDEVLRMEVGDLHFERGRIVIHSARKDGLGGEDRIIPMHPQLAEILRPYVRRLGRLSGPLFPGREGARLGKWTKALDLVGMRAGFPRGYFRTRMMRTAYATFRSTCDDVPNADVVRGELGHSGRSDMLERVYSRAQLRTWRMGSEMAYRIERFEGQAEVQAALAAMETWTPGMRVADQQRTAERAAVVARFLAACEAEGLGAKRVQRLAGLARWTFFQLRAGKLDLSTMQEQTVEKMRTFLATREPAPVAVSQEQRGRLRRRAG